MAISIVIPLYNKARHIKNTIESVLGQSYQDFEIIVVDDGSTDAGAKVVLQISDLRIRLLQQENGGVSKARNTGILNAKNDLIAFLDADDIWSFNHLETLNRMAINFPEAGMYATSYCIRKANVDIQLDLYGIPSNPWEGIVNNYFESITFGDNIISSSSVAIKKTVFKDVDMFPDGVRMGEDQDMWLRIALKYPVCFSTIVTAVYNLEADNRSCLSMQINDLKSPLLTTWFDYRGTIYLENYIVKTQLNLLWTLITAGYGYHTRQILIQIASQHGYIRIAPYFIASFFKKNVFDLLKVIKKIKILGKTK